MAKQSKAGLYVNSSDRRSRTMYQELGPVAMGIAFAVLGIITGLCWILFGSMMGFGMMGYYGGMMGGWYAGSIIFMAIGGFIVGWITASVYNWALKRKW